MGNRVSDDAIERDRRSSLARYHREKDRYKKSQKAYRGRAFENRPFIGWDGEGYDAFVVDSSGVADIRHRYMLFGCSNGDYVFDVDLSTSDCLDLILAIESANRDVFHVGFAFEYDVNMILRDLKWTGRAILNVSGHCRYVNKQTGRRYRIEHIPHKWFRVSSEGVSATIYDAFGFFHCRYTTALKKYDVGDDAIHERIATGKAKRGHFTYADKEMVIDYWRDEISLFPPLMDKIRTAAYSGGYRVSEWHGPGALASYLLRTTGVTKWHSKSTPAEVKYAIRAAYAGGRFQLWQCGLYIGDIYTADINSAYIYACSLMPRMDTGKWVRQNPDSIDIEKLPRFGLFHIQFDAGREMSSECRKRGIPCPPYALFHRDKNGILRWPYKTTGWYWTPEAELVMGYKGTRILEAWFFNDSGTNPFEFVHSIYDRRLEFQQEGNPAEKAYKWALAAMYGAFAQRVGWDKATRKPPHSHELAWAGYITSWCRAAVFRASVPVHKQGGLISIDTDGITSMAPFDESRLVNGEGDGLGQWKIVKYSGILAWQNGIYWLRDMDGNWIDPKTRGVPKGKISIDAALTALGEANFTARPYKQPYIRITRTRFIGYRQALRGQFDKYCRWVTEPVKILFGGNLTGKGSHLFIFCRACRGKDGAPMHTVTHTMPDETQSIAHRLPWLEDQPGLSDHILNDNFNPITREEDIA